MIRLYFIRHGKTYGNTQRRYIGRTDEPLCGEGRAELEALPRPEVDFLYASPMKRCIQTAEILFPQLKPIVVPDFRECDFGDFENKNFRELDGNKDYQAFVDSGATLPFPGGESREEFQERCVKAFREVIIDISSRKIEKRLSGTGAAGYKAAALVVHGGTIMSILGALSDPKEDYFYWQVQNGEGYSCLVDEIPPAKACGGEEIKLYDIEYIGC